jgi:hypothetical protein
MTVTTRTLTQAAGIAAAAAGAIFIAVQINHPPFDSFLTDTNEWVVRCTAKAVMTALALAGITGMYLRQVRQMRVLGLVGYLVFAAGYLMMWATEVMAVTVLAALTHTAPGFAEDAVIASGAGHPSGDIGQLQILFNLTGVCYMLGGLLRHRAVPCSDPRPVGRRPAGGEHRRHRRPGGAAAGLRSAHGRPRRRRPHRPRHLLVA